MSNFVPMLRIPHGTYAMPMFFLRVGEQEADVTRPTCLPSLNILFPVFGVGPIGSSKPTSSFLGFHVQNLMGKSDADQVTQVKGDSKIK